MSCFESVDAVPTHISNESHTWVFILNSSTNANWFVDTGDRGREVMEAEDINNTNPKYD